MRYIGYAAAILICGLLLAGSYLHKIEVEPDEAWGFITGAACVWLTVKENIWNWPIGSASSALYAYTFWHTKLFGDMWLQVVYVVLGFLGWYWWLRGGEKHTTLTVHRINAPMTATLMVIVIASTARNGGRRCPPGQSGDDLRHRRVCHKRLACSLSW
jgi:nicotinamide mononucleotide transporter